MAELKFKSYSELPVAEQVTKDDKLVGINLSTNTMELIKTDGLGGGGNQIDLYTVYGNIGNGGTAWIFSVWESIDDMMNDLNNSSTDHAIPFDDFIQQCQDKNINFLATAITLHLLCNYGEMGE